MYFKRLASFCKPSASLQRPSFVASIGFGHPDRSALQRAHYLLGRQLHIAPSSFRCKLLGSSKQVPTGARLATGE